MTRVRPSDANASGIPFCGGFEIRFSRRRNDSPRPQSFHCTVGHRRANGCPCGSFVCWSSPALRRFMVRSRLRRKVAALIGSGDSDRGQVRRGCQRAGGFGFHTARQRPDNRHPVGLHRHRCGSGRTRRGRTIVRHLGGGKVRKVGSLIWPLVLGERGLVAVVTFDREVRWRQDWTSDETKITAAFQGIRAEQRQQGIEVVRWRVRCDFPLERPPFVAANPAVAVRIPRSRQRRQSERRRVFGTAGWGGRLRRAVLGISHRLHTQEHRERGSGAPRPVRQAESGARNAEWRAAQGLVRSEAAASGPALTSWER